MNFVLILISFAATLVLTIRVRKALLRRNLLDRPNERSSHSEPVPRGGGWALLMVLIPALVAVDFLQPVISIFCTTSPPPLGGGLGGGWFSHIPIFGAGGERPPPNLPPRGEEQYRFLPHAGLLAGICILASISWLDDRRQVSAAARLSLHLLAAYLGSLCFPAEALIFGGALPFAIDRAAMIVGWAWFINLYNFMDGIDGITGVETVSIATGTCLVMTAMGYGDPFVSTLTLLLTGAALGFLALNWHPAKIFLGDVGSVPLGYLTGFCLLTVAVHGHLIAALILPLYYLADSGITITKRALRGEKIWQAHRQHFYQRAALGLGRHDKVVVRVAVANIALIGAALFAVPHPAMGLGIAALIVAALLYHLGRVGRTVNPPPLGEG